MAYKSMAAHVLNKMVMAQILAGIVSKTAVSPECRTEADIDMLARLFRAPPKPPFILPELFTTPPKLLAPWYAAGAEAFGTLPRLCDGLTSPSFLPSASDGRGGMDSAGTQPSITAKSALNDTANHCAISMLFPYLVLLMRWTAHPFRRPRKIVLLLRV